MQRLYVPILVSSRSKDAKLKDDVVSCDHFNPFISINYEWLADVITKMFADRFRQVGGTKEEATSIADQHSWFKVAMAVYMVEVEVPVECLMEERQSEVDITGWSGMGRAKYPCVKKNVELKASHIVAVHKTNQVVTRTVNDDAAVIAECLANIKALTLDKQYPLSRRFADDKAEIARVDDKATLGLFRGIHDTVITFSVADFDNEITNITIKLVNRGFIQGFGRAHSSLFISFREGRERQRFMLLDNLNITIMENLNRLAASLPANCVEKYNPKPVRRHTYVNKQEFWSANGGWSTASIFEREYKEKVDPLILNAFEKLIADKWKGRKVNVLDIGGGKGRTACMLLNKASEMGHILNYTLIEPDQSQCDMAKELFAQNNLSVTIVNNTLEGFKNSELFKEYEHSVDFIISSGGAINTEVVSHATSVESIKTMKSLICMSGFIIASGLSGLNIKRKEMEAEGYRFFATYNPHKYDPDKILALKDSKQLYVMTHSQ